MVSLSRLMPVMGGAWKSRRSHRQRKQKRKRQFHLTTMQCRTKYSCIRSGEGGRSMIVTHVGEGRRTRIHAHTTVIGVEVSTSTWARAIFGKFEGGYSVETEGRERNIHGLGASCVCVSTHWCSSGAAAATSESYRGPVSYRECIN